MGLAAALLVVGSSAALAFGVFPGSWKVIDSGKAVRKRPVGMLVAIVRNNGADTVTVSSKGTLKTVSGNILAGEKGTVILPKGAKNVKILDGNFANGKGAKGFVFWAKKQPKTGGIIIGGGGGAD